jgi:hypothetical protein
VTAAVLVTALMAAGPSTTVAVAPGPCAPRAALERELRRAPVRFVDDDAELTIRLDAEGAGHHLRVLDVDGVEVMERLLPTPSCDEAAVAAALIIDRALRDIVVRLPVLDGGVRRRRRVERPPEPPRPTTPVEPVAPVEPKPPPEPGTAKKPPRERPPARRDPVVATPPEMPTRPPAQPNREPTTPETPPIPLPARPATAETNPPSARPPAIAETAPARPPSIAETPPAARPPAGAETPRPPATPETPPIPPARPPAVVATPVSVPPPPPPITNVASGAWPPGPRLLVAAAPVADAPIEQQLRPGGGRFELLAGAGFATPTPATLSLLLGLDAAFRLGTPWRVGLLAAFSFGGSTPVVDELGRARGTLSGQTLFVLPHAMACLDSAVELCGGVRAGVRLAAGTAAGPYIFQTRTVFAPAPTVGPGARVALVIGPVVLALDVTGLVNVTTPGLGVEGLSAAIATPRFELLVQASAGGRTR